MIFWQTSPHVIRLKYRRKDGYNKWISPKIIFFKFIFCDFLATIDADAHRLKKVGFEIQNSFIVFQSRFWEVFPREGYYWLGFWRWKDPPSITCVYLSSQIKYCFDFHFHRCLCCRKSKREGKEWKSKFLLQNALFISTSTKIESHAFKSTWHFQLKMCPLCG